jgi:hypothetical protein
MIHILYNQTVVLLFEVLDILYIILNYTNEKLLKLLKNDKIIHNDHCLFSILSNEQKDIHV